MKEKGYDLGTRRSKSLEDVPGGMYDPMVTMGCGDECAFVPARRREDWELPDPGEMEPPEFAPVRNQIERYVIELIGRLEVG